MPRPRQDPRRPGVSRRTAAGGPRPRPDEEQFQLLLGAARRGDEGSWRTLYEWLSPDVRGYLRAQRPDDVDAVLGDTWLAVARDLHDFSGGPEDLRRWVFTVARHRAIDRRRHSRARPSWPAAPGRLLGLVDASGASGAGQPEQEVEQADGTHQVMQALDGLTAKQRDALALRFIGGLDTHEVAAVMGIRRNAVKSLQRRGIARLRARAAAGRPPLQGARSAE